MSAWGLVFMCLPISFVIGCILAVYEYPSRTRRDGIVFFPSVSFLFHNLKPEACWFAIVFIIRNLLISLAPVLPHAALQLVFVIPAGTYMF